MTAFITIISENILTILAFAIYAGLVYYMVNKYLRRSRRGGAPEKRRFTRKEKSTEFKARKDFSRSLPTCTSKR